MPTSSLASIARLVGAASLNAIGVSVGLQRPTSARQIRAQASFTFLPNWELLTQNGIAIDAANNVWYAGHLEDVLLFGSNRLLLASASGGVWLATTDPQTAPIALSNAWQLTSMHSLVQGPRGPRHFYAAGESGALFETETESLRSVARFLQLSNTADIATKLGLSRPYTVRDILRLTDAPLFEWKQIPLVDGTNQPLGAPAIRHMVCVTDLQPPKLVLGTDAGVLWSDIPSLGQQYQFVAAVGVPETRCSGLALASQDPATSRFIVCCPRGNPETPEANGVYFGTWLFNNLVMRKANLLGDVDTVQWKDAVVDSSAGNRSVVYAAVFASGKALLSMKQACRDSGLAGPPFRAKGLAARLSVNTPFLLGALLRQVDPPRPADLIYAVLRSNDGGASWLPVGPRQRVAESVLFPRDPGQTQNGRSMSIAVSNASADVVAVGTLIGPWIGRNTPAAFSWEEHGDKPDRPGYSAHIHADIHGMHFDARDPSGQTLYMCSDGGLVFTTNLGGEFHSSVNRLLPTLEFQSYPSRMFSGASGASARTPGLVAGALQDNGIVFASGAAGPESPWHQLEGGDGLVALVLQNDLLLFWPLDGKPVRLSKWTGTEFGPSADVQVRTPAPGPNPTVPAGSTFTNLFVEPVLHPRFQKLSSGQTMIAVAAADPAGAALQDVWGLFADTDGGNPAWEFLVSAPLAAGDSISAAASDDGSRVLLGTQAEAFFSFDSASGALSAMPLDQTLAGKIGPILQFSFLSGGSAIARCAETLLRFDPAQARWTAIGGNGLPTEDGSFYFMAVDTPPGRAPVLYVGTDRGVHASWDGGANWLPVSQGLPAESHPSTLRSVVEPGGNRLLYLFTYGRSTWRARLN